MLGHLVSNAAIHSGKDRAHVGAPNLLQRLWVLLLKRTR